MTADDLAKACSDLVDARKIAAVGTLATVAARCAYFAAFHAAEAFIAERTGRIAKSHSGVRSEFARLAKDTSQIDQSFTTFPAKAYTYKEIGDDRIGSAVAVSEAEAHDAIEAAARFVDRITAVLSANPGRCG